MVYRWFIGSYNTFIFKVKQHILILLKGYNLNHSVPPTRFQFFISFTKDKHPLNMCHSFLYAVPGKQSWPDEFLSNHNYCVDEIRESPN